MSHSRPAMRPARPHFSSGPCAKPPGYDLDQLRSAIIGRNHRSGPGKARLKLAIDLTREVLQVPDDFLVGIVPASDTGAVEMAMWSLLGPRPVQILAFDVFGRTWATDARRLPVETEVLEAPDGQLPMLHKVNGGADLVFAWNGTTSGACVPNADFISAEREGLTICDATSSVFAQPLAWDKLDVVTFSWQKALGGEAAHGVLILGPRAVERLESYVPAWPLPKIFRLTKSDGTLNRPIFEGETINTPSMLCVEDWLVCLQWAQKAGGLAAMQARTDANAEALGEWVEHADWVDFLVEDPAIRSNSSVCLKLTGPEAADTASARRIVNAMAGLLEREGVAFDVAGHRDAPPGLRVWCGPTVDTDDIIALTPWLDWAYAEATTEA